MRNNLLKFLFACTFCTAINITHAQLKQLTADQMLHDKTEGLLKELPKAGGWKDDAHYVLYKSHDTVLVNVSDGKETRYVAGEKASVQLKNGDIFFKPATNDEKQITNTKEEEKNPTLSPDNTKVAFTRNNDLYVIDVASGKEDRLTNDGSDVIYNGRASDQRLTV